MISPNRNYQEDFACNRKSPDPAIQSFKRVTTKENSAEINSVAMTETRVRRIAAAKLPRKPLLWDIDIEQGKIASINPHDMTTSEPQQQGSDVMNADGRLVAPSLCHAHIHLDKCFLLQDPRFIDLQIQKGDFEEAMTLGKSAKERMSNEDLLRRGGQLIEESIDHGVTAIRAFVEVDGVVDMKCLEAGLELKSKFADRCHVQICAFAQLPLFSGDDEGEAVRKLMTEAAKRDGVDVVGSTPYVEDNEEKQRKNIEWIVDLALQNSKMLDLHLDYNLESDTKPFVWDVFKTVRDKQWAKEGNRQITLGHCTRLTFFKKEEWSKLREDTKDLHVSFVGLPTSDLFMMRTEERYRGSMQVPELIREHGFNAAIAVNNLGNAFTPQGSSDPLTVACLGVGLYQTGTNEDAELLFVSYEHAIAGVE